MRYVLFISLAWLAGCSQQMASSVRPGVTERVQNSPMSAYTLDDYASSLTMQLLHSSPSVINRGKVVIGNFSPADSLANSVSTDSAPHLGKQLQLSMQNLLTQAGFEVISLDGRAGLQLQNDNSVILTPVTSTPSHLNTDYLLSGVMTAQQHAYLVNVKLVNVSRQSIAAAATAEIPLNVFWSREQVQMRNGRLYRIELEGARK